MLTVGSFFGLPVAVKRRKHQSMAFVLKVLFQNDGILNFAWEYLLY